MTPDTRHVAARGEVVGLVVNPVAGLGGSAGLKGSDGASVQREALTRGAIPRAGERAAQAVRTLLSRRPGARLVTVSGVMGEDSVRAAGGAPELVRLPLAPRAGGTKAADTRAAVVALAGVDLLLFAGGDGTARDVLDALRSLGDQAPPVLGIPAGVKVYSGCFALSPATAGFLAADHLSALSRARTTAAETTPSGVSLTGTLATNGGELDEAEVVDLDEERYRYGLVSPRLYGTVRVPAARGALSGRKVGASATAAGTVGGIAREVVARMRPGVRYVLGPGATTSAVGRRLGLATTLLGVDVVEVEQSGGVLVAGDVSERELFTLVNGHHAVVVLSVIGGQGFVVGRGNQQISPRVMDAVTAGRTGGEQTAGPAGGGLMVLASQQKLAALGGRPLLVDSGDEDLDRRLAGHVQVITGYRESTIYRICAASEEFHG
ncbi:NAD(+)/NADH kinase [Nonomuraea sp. NPDC000554]|uniref:ATP-NAD kinase family protein n=1 Tax=Nonomuraea sp. NPDC000554 TaxID=3154259 RepID=UPI0033324AE6